MVLTQNLGDNVTHRVPLRWGGRAFVPTGYNLIFTVKSAPDTQADAAASIQKKSGGFGVTTSGSTALVALLPQDTAGSVSPAITALTPATYTWDVQAQSVADPADVRTVATGTLVLRRDVTRGVDTAIPIVLAQPPLSYDTELITYE